MLASEIITEVQNHGFDDLDTTTLLAYLNDAYHEFCGEEPWPFLEKTATLTVDEAGKVTAPTDIRSIQSIVDTTNGTTLTPKRRDEIVSRFTLYLTQNNPARYYFWVGDALYLYPIPGGGTYVMDYIRDEPDLSSSDAPIFKAKYHRILVYLTAIRAAVIGDDYEAADYFDARAEKNIQKARIDLWKKNYDEPDTIEDLTWQDYIDWDVY